MLISRQLIEQTLYAIYIRYNAKYYNLIEGDKVWVV